MTVVKSKLALGGHAKTGDGAYTVLYDVETNNNDDLPLSVLIGARLLTLPPNDPVPEYGALYAAANDSDQFSYATQFTVRNRAARFPQKWVVAVGYEKLTHNQNFLDPVSRDPLFWLESNRHSKQVFKDKSGNVITNSANRIIPDPIEVDSANLVIRGTRQFRTIAEILQISEFYQFTTNDIPWPQDPNIQKPARSWLCHPIESSPLMIENGFEHAVASYRFEYNADLWNEFIPDRGVAYLDGSGNLVNESDINGNVVGEVTNLEADGTRRSNALAPLFIGGASGVEVIREESWTGLGLNI